VRTLVRGIGFGISCLVVGCVLWRRRAIHQIVDGFWRGERWLATEPLQGEWGSVWLTITLNRVPFPDGALLLSPLFEPGYVLGIHSSPTQDEARLLWRVLGFPLPHRLDHVHVLGPLDVLGVEVPLLQLRLVLLLPVV
jgi:hypothetical protein